MRGRLREFELVETPPHRAEFWFSFVPCCPLHSPSKTGVTALVARGARDAARRGAAEMPDESKREARLHHFISSAIRSTIGLGVA